MLRQRATVLDGNGNLWNAKSMFDAAIVVSDAMRDIDRRDGEER